MRAVYPEPVEGGTNRPPAITRSRDRAWAGGVAFCCLLAAAIWPVFSVEIPALTDYPGHLARIFALATIDRDPLLAKFFSIHWAIIPNLAVDVLLPVVARHIGIFPAGQVFLAATIILTVTGVTAIQWAVHRRLSIAAFLPFLFIYNGIFLFGFLNYLFGIALVLWATAAWIGLRDHPPVLRAAVSLLAVCAEFFCHLFAVGLYGIAIFGYEIWRFRAAPAIAPGPARRQRLVDAIVLAAPFLPVLGLMAASPTSALSDQPTIWDAGARFFGLYFIIKTYSIPTDVAVLIVLAGGGLWLHRRGMLRLHPAGLMLLILTVPVFLIMPDVLLGAWAADRRLPIGVTFILLGFCDLRIPQWRLRIAMTAAIAVLSFLRYGEVALVWRYYDGLYADVRRSFAQIQPGSTVLVGQVDHSQLRYTLRQPLWHVVELVMIDRSSFDPIAFAAPGHQVLEVNPAYEALRDPLETAPPTTTELAVAAHDPEAPVAQGKYWRDWPATYDYLMVLYEENGRNPLPDRLTLLYRGRECALFRIDRR